MRTDIAIDKLCDICPIIADISAKAKTDTELQALLVAGRTAGREGVLRMFPKLKAKCEEEIYAILAILSDKTVEEIKAQDAVETLKQIVAITQNKDFISFFTSFSPSTATSGELSAQSDNTEAKK